MSEIKNSPDVVDQGATGVGERGWVAVFWLVCLIIFFTNLGGAALFEPDEGRNAEKAREILLLNDWVTPHHNFLPTLDKPMAYFWPVALSFAVFGFSEWAARLPSALAALGCLVVVYRFARQQWGLPAALWSSLVLATSVEFFLFARLAILDMSLTFFLAWALCSFYSAVRAGDPRATLFHSVIMYAAMGVGTLIKGPIAVVLPGMVIFVFMAVTRQWSLVRQLGFMRGVLIYFAIVTPWYLLAEVRNPGYLRYFILEEHFFRYLTSEFNRSAGWYHFFIVLAVGFLPWTFLLPPMVRTIWRRIPDHTTLFIAFWIILPFVFFSISKSKLPQYILPIYPGLALLCGRFLAEKLSDAGAKRRGILMFPWLFSIGIVVYLLAGAAWPGIVAPQIREAVVRDVSLIAACGALLLLIFGIFLRSHRKMAPSNWRELATSTTVGLAIFCFLVGHLMIGASEDRGSKGLARAAAPFIARDDRIAFYDTYLAGIAFYLAVDRPLLVAYRETKDAIMGSNYLAMRRSTTAGGHGKVVFSFSEFAQQWNRENLVLRVFVKAKNLQRLSRDVGGAPRILTKFDEYLLVTNQ